MSAGVWKVYEKMEEEKVEKRRLGVEEERWWYDEAEGDVNADRISEEGDRVEIEPERAC